MAIAAVQTKSPHDKPLTCGHHQGEQGVGSDVKGTPRKMSALRCTIWQGSLPSAT